MKRPLKEKQTLFLISPMLHQGGFERVCITTARLLEPYFDVRIVIFDDANIAYNIEGLQIINLNLGVQKGKVKKLLNILKRTKKMRALKKQLKPVISYSFGPTANMVNAFSKTKETKVWLGLRNYTDVEETGKMKLFTKLADLIVCCSKTIERKVQSMYHFNQTATLYNLYDVETIRKEAMEKTPKLPWGTQDDQGKDIINLISMGRDDDQKCYWHMIKIFHEIHEKLPQTRLILLGAGNFQYYKTMAEELGLTQVIHFAGMQKEPYQYLKMAQVYLMTSKNEGFPNALVEGMSLGLAPVSTDCMTGPAEILLENGDSSALETLKQEGKLPVLYGDYGILMPVMDTSRDLVATNITEEEKQMASVVIDLLNNPEKLSHYQNKALERAKIFTYEHYVEAFLKLTEQ